MKNVARTRWFLKLGLSVLLLGLLFSKVDLGSVGKAMLQTSIPPFIAAVLCGFWVQWITGAQMRIGLQPFGINLKTTRLFEIGLISGFYSLVVPGGMVTGGAVTWLKLTKDSGQGLASAAMVVYLRAVNTAILVFIGLAGACVDQASVIPGLRSSFVILSVCSLIGLLGLMVPAVGRLIRQLLVWFGRRFRVGSKVRTLCVRLIRVFHCVYWIRGKRMWLILFYGLVINLGFFAVWVLFAWAVQLPVSGFVVAWIAAVQGILQLMPITVGGLGVREGSLVALLAPYGLTQEHALALSMTVFIAMIIGAAVGGACEMKDLLKPGKTK